jgi:hypothetical protein
MIKSFNLFVLALLCIASATPDAFFGNVTTEEFQDPNMNNLGYAKAFATNFTVTIFGVPPARGGGERDLKAVQRQFLRKFNSIQKKIEKKIAKQQKAPIQEPGILMYDSEITQQWISNTITKAGDAVDFNILLVDGFLVCVEESCPDGETDEQRRMLDGQLASVACDLRNNLLSSGRDYFLNVTCVRVATEQTDYVDECSCDGFGIVAAGEKPY